ncbi:MAG: hypothetical protein ACFB0C_20475 [Leptolyngbyaceae cyanobacterium]
MASSKLSDADKQMILDLYRQPAETTSTLAERYGVSSSTISRVLKQNIPAEEYGQLIQQKRSGTSAAPAPQKTVAPTKTAKDAPTPVSEVPEVQTDPVNQPEASAKPAAPIRRKRSRSRSAAKAEEDQDKPSAPVASSSQPEDEPFSSAETSLNDSEDDVEAASSAWDEDDEPLADDDYGDDDDLEEDEDDEDWDDSANAQSSPRQEQLEVLPFEQATFQKTCYLVVDRLAELITCPLRDFSDLGAIPEEEGQARTLPVFDNHRVARRFSRRNQRVIKIPDASILQKTQPYLQAKGITRLLINGQVYALS